MQSGDTAPALPLAPRSGLCITQWNAQPSPALAPWGCLAPLLCGAEKPLAQPFRQWEDIFLLQIQPCHAKPIGGAQPSHPVWEQGIHMPWRHQAELPAPIWVTSEHELSLPIWSPCTASGKIYIVLKHSTVLSTEMIELQMLTRCRTLFYY